MIRYNLRCARGHTFESWFASAAAFDALQRADLLSCAVCSDATVEKALMAPTVRNPDISGAPALPATGPDRPLSAPASPAEQALAELRRRIEAESDDVGRNFAREARAIHEGTAPRRSIRGEARPDEARRLIEDGVPVIPLPWPAPRRQN